MCCTLVTGCAQPSEAEPCQTAAGRHGIDGGRAGTLPLTPGQHAFEIDYSQV